MKGLVVALLCIMSLSAVAESEYSYDSKSMDSNERIQTGRYSFVQNIPPVDQLNPLKVVIRTRIPQSINSIGQTVEFLLARSGYVLADSSVLSEEAKVLLNLPLPAIHRELGPMTLDRALITLSGEAFALVVDPVNRKVTFELAENLAGGKS